MSRTSAAPSLGGAGGTRPTGNTDHVAHALGILRDELSLAMALAGCRTIGEITSGLVAAE